MFAKDEHGPCKTHRHFYFAYYDEEENQWFVQKCRTVGCSRTRVTLALRQTHYHCATIYSMSKNAVP